METTLLTVEKLELPRTKPLEYTAEFDCSVLQVPISQLLNAATLQRNLLSNAIDDVSINGYDNLISICNKYLESVWQIKMSLAAAVNVMIRIRQDWKFQWTSPISESNRNKYYGFDVFIYELCMVSIVRIYSQINLAHNITEKIKTIDQFKQEHKDELVKAVKLLREASGLAEFVQLRLLPQWRSKPESDKDYPLELSHGYIGRIGKLCLISAQKLTSYVVLKKIDFDQIGKGSNPQNIRTLSMLLKGVKNKITEFKLEDNDDGSAMLSILIDVFLSDLLTLQKSEEIEHSSEPDKASSEAVTYAHHTLVQLSLFFNYLKKTTKPTYLKHISQSISYYQSRVEKRFETLKEDNDKVYFGVVDSNLNIKDKIDQIKAGFIPTTLEYNTPKVKTLSFERTNTSNNNIINTNENEKQTIPSSINPIAHNVEKLKVSNSNVSQETFALNSQNIDKEVFSQLPAHIQEEIMAEANQQRQSVRF